MCAMKYVILRDAAEGEGREYVSFFTQRTATTHEASWTRQRKLAYEWDSRGTAMLVSARLGRRAMVREVYT